MLKDKALKNTIINQLYKIIAGPLTLLFIPIYLLKEEQGYWYTFTSISALSIFADLGFTVIVLQFAAHEFSFLKFDANGLIVGDEFHKHKLADFFRFSVKWLTRVSAIVFFIIISGGFYFLDTKTEIFISWKISWFIYSFASCIVFINSCILSFYEGCNGVAVTQIIRFKISVFSNIVMLISLFLGFKLYSLAFSAFISAFVGLFYIIKVYKNSLIQLWKISKKSTYNWGNEFFNLIWRYAVSWISGYGSMQIYVPLAFKYYDSVVAGKIGLSIALCMAAFNISNVFLTSKIPDFNMLIEQKQWNELNKLFTNAFTKTIFLFVFGLGGFYIVFYIFYNNNIEILQRLLSPVPLLMLFIAWLLQNIINGFAVYLRAYKEEPLYKASFLNAVYVIISTLFVINKLGYEAIFIGFLTGNIFMLPYVYYLYKRKVNLNMENI